MSFSHFTETLRRKVKFAEGAAAGEWVSGCLRGTFQDVSSPIIRGVN